MTPTRESSSSSSSPSPPQSLRRSSAASAAVSTSRDDIAAFLNAPVELRFAEARRDLERMAVHDDGARFAEHLQRVTPPPSLDDVRHVDMHALSLVDVLRLHNARACIDALESRVPGAVTGAPPLRVSASALQCPLCRECMFQPLRPFCNHAACRVCLYQAQMQALRCPLCADALTLPDGYVVDETLRRAVAAIDAAAAEDIPPPLDVTRALDNLLGFFCDLTHDAIPPPVFSPQFEKAPLVMQSGVVVTFMPLVEQERQCVTLALGSRVEIRNAAGSTSPPLTHFEQAVEHVRRWLIDWLAPLMARSGGGSARFHRDSQRAGSAFSSSTWSLYVWNAFEVPVDTKLARAQLAEFLTRVNSDALHLRDALQALCNALALSCEYTPLLLPPPQHTLPTAAALDEYVLDALERPLELKALRAYRGFAAATRDTYRTGVEEPLWLRSVIALTQHSLTSLGNFVMCTAQSATHLQHCKQHSGGGGTQPCDDALQRLARLDAAFHATRLLAVNGFRARSGAPSTGAAASNGTFNRDHCAVLPWHVWHSPAPADRSELSVTGVGRDRGEAALAASPPLMPHAVECDCRTQRALVYCSVQTDVMLARCNVADLVATPPLRLWNREFDGAAFVTHSGCTLSIWTNDDAATARASPVLLFTVPYSALPLLGDSGGGEAHQHLVDALRSLFDTYAHACRVHVAKQLRALRSSGGSGHDARQAQLSSSSLHQGDVSPSTAAAPLTPLPPASPLSEWNSLFDTTTATTTTIAPATTSTSSVPPSPTTWFL